MKKFFLFVILALCSLPSYAAPTDTPTPIVTGTPTFYASGNTGIVKFRCNPESYGRIYWTNPEATPYAHYRTDSSWTTGVKTFTISLGTGGTLVKIQAINKSSGVTFNEVGPLQLWCNLTATPTPTWTSVPTITETETPMDTETPTDTPTPTPTGTPCCLDSWVDFVGNTKTGTYDFLYYDACEGCTIIKNSPITYTP